MLVKRSAEDPNTFYLCIGIKRYIFTRYKGEILHRYKGWYKR